MNVVMKVLFLLSTVIVLSGCNLLKPRVVTKTTYIVPNVPSKLLEPCEAPTPPEKEYYVKQDPLKRESMLTDYSISLLHSLSTCNSKLTGVRDFLEKTRETVNKTNETEK